MRYCAAPGCRQEPSGLRADGMCFAHGKEADGLLSLKAKRGYERPVTPWPRKETMVRLSEGPRFTVASSPERHTATER